MDNKLRQIQLCELEILKVIADICERHDIDYWLAYGTMLGAVRHKGFIPWDDDLDIYMKQADFKKFRRICKKELPAEYFLQTPQSDPCVGNLFYKVRKNGTYMPEDNLKNYNKKIHEGIWVDIFPLVELSNKEKYKNKQIAAFTRLQELRFYHADRQTWNFKQKLRDIAVSLNEIVLRYKIKLLGSKRSNKLIVVGNCFYPHMLSKIPTCTMDSQFFNGFKLYKFEDSEFHGIAEADKYLKSQYGADYMTPKRYNQHISDYSDVIVS